MYSGLVCPLHLVHFNVACVAHAYRTLKPAAVRAAPRARPQRDTVAGQLERLSSQLNSVVKSVNAIRKCHTSGALVGADGTCEDIAMAATCDLSPLQPAANGEVRTGLGVGLAY